MKKLAIIGAGLTGITLAQKLNNNFAVTVFEKSRGIGGRITTKRIEGFEFDHGAQFFTAKSELFKQFIKQMITVGSVSRWDARFAELNDSDILSEQVWNKSFPRYVGNPRMNAMCKYLATNLDVRLNTRIKAIKPGNYWRLFDDNDNDLGTYDWVIVTAPPEQTLQLMPASFKFIKNIMAIKMLGCYSLMLGFETIPPLNFDAAMVQNADISWISVNSSKPARPNKPTLLVNSTNCWAEANMDNKQQTVIDYLCQELSRITGLDTNQAKCQVLHRWRYANIGQQPYHDGFIDFDQKLAACGDWCIESRVESAFLVGQTVANKILATIK